MKEDKWTPETLCTALQRFILKTKFTERDRTNMLEISRNMKVFNPLQTISQLIKISEDRFDIYAPAERLLQDLETLCNFPNNAEYLGLRDQMNYRMEPEILAYTKERKFLSKQDVFFKLYHFLIAEMFLQDEFSKILLQSHGNKIYRKLKNSYDLIPVGIAENVVKYVTSSLENESTNDTTLKLTSYTVNEVGMILSKFYDIKYDEHLLELLRDRLIDENKKKPIRSNKMSYEAIYSTHIRISNIMKSVLNEFPFVFQPFTPKLKNFPVYPVIRVFRFINYLDYEVKFAITSEVCSGLMSANGTEFITETSKGPDEAMLFTTSFKSLKEMLKSLNVSMDKLPIIQMDIKQTSRDTVVPIISSNGSHYKLAIDVFNEILEIFTTELRWFDTVPTKHYHNLYTWFENQKTYFDDSIDAPYLIKLCKIDELKEQARKDLAKYARTPLYDTPHNAEFSSIQQVEEELHKLSEGFGIEKCVLDQITSRALKRSPKTKFTKADVYVFYQDYWKVCMTQDIKKMKPFFKTQTNTRELFRISKMFELLESSKQMKKDELKDCLKILKLREIHADSLAHLKGTTLRTVLRLSGDKRDLIFNQWEVYDNDTCLKKALDSTLSGEERCYELIYETEYRKMENSPDYRRVFYLEKTEMLMFCDSTKKKFKAMMRSCSREENDNNNKNRRTSFWKNKFNDYPAEFYKSMTEWNQVCNDPGLLTNRCLEVRKFFHECFAEMKSLRNYHKCDERKILMRIMCEMRIEDQREWHLFSEEVLEAIEVVLENENRLDSMKGQIEKWRMKWTALSTVSVKLFETILGVVGINKSKFVLVPDIEFCKNMAELPLRMGYNALAILSPFRRKVYHQAQAQYLIFQYGACDIIWHHEYDILKQQQRDNVLSEMLKVGKGYIAAEDLEESLENVKFCPSIQKTALSLFCEKSYDDKLTAKRDKECYNYWQLEIRKHHSGLSIFQHRFVLMRLWVNLFFQDFENHPLLDNVFKAMSTSFAIMNVKKMEDFERRKIINDEKVDFEAMSLCTTRACSIKTGNSELDDKPFLDKHYFFDEDDPIEMWACDKEAIGESAKPKNKQKDITNKIMRVLPNVVSKTSEELWKPVESLWSCFKAALKEEFDEEEAIELSGLLPKLDENTPVKKAISEHLEFKKIDGQDMYKRKKVEIVEPVKKVRVKPEREDEKPKIVTKYVTETKVVESCRKCREIEKDTTKFNEKCEEFEKEIAKNRRDIRQKDDDLGILKSQIAENKQMYRDGIQKQKEIIDGRDEKIKQLEEQLKQLREDSRTEKKELYAEMKKKEYLSNDKVNKMSAELERIKFEENKKDKRINNLEWEVEELNSKVEGLEETHKSTESQLEMTKKYVQHLEEQLARSSHYTEENLATEQKESSCLDAIEVNENENFEQFNEPCSSTTNFENEASYLCLICRDKIETHQQSTNCEICNRKYHSPCATSWLRVNSICPICREFLCDPSDYPTLH